MSSVGLRDCSAATSREALGMFSPMYLDGSARNVKIVYLGSNLALSTAQFEALVRSVGEPNAVVHALSPTEDGEQLHLIQLAWSDDRRSGHDSLATRFWLYQVPTNPLHMHTRMQILRGADFLVLIADGRSPVHESFCWIDELKNHHASPLHEEAPPRLVIQYVCPPDSTNDATTLKEALDTGGEFAALVFDNDAPDLLAARTMEFIVDSIGAKN